MWHLANVLIDADKLIDLDVQPAERERTTIASRPVLAALCLLLVALLAGSADLARQRPPVVLAAGSADLTFVHGDRLFIVGRAAGAQSLRTYRLPDGRLLGRATVDGLAPVSDVTQAGGTILLTDQGTTGGDPQTVAVDGTTGRELWRRTAAPVSASAAAGIALLSTSLLGADFADEAVDLRTGALRWRVPAPAGFLTAAGDAGGLPRWLVSVTPDGRLTSYDGRTGRQVATTAAVPADESGGYPILAEADHLMIGTATGTTAYSLPALTPRWHAETSPPANTADVVPDSKQTACGPVICTFRQTRAMSVLDPATGRALWTANGFVDARPAGAYLLAITATGVIFVLDAATGRVHGDFGGWRGLLGPDGLRYAVHAGADHNTLWYGRLDPARAIVHVLGSVRHVSGPCSLGTGVLVCPQAGAVAVWQLA